MGKRQHVSDVDRVVGSNARNIRILDGRSQDAIVRAMKRRGFHWHQTTMSRVERGLRPLSLGEAAGLSEILEQPVSALLGTGYIPRLPQPIELVENIMRDARELRTFHEEDAA